MYKFSKFMFFYVLFIIIYITPVRADIFDLLFPNRIKYNKVLDTPIPVDDIKPILQQLEIPDTSDNRLDFEKYSYHAIKYATSQKGIHENYIFYSKYDLNNDGISDIIYSGLVGPPEAMTIVWLNDGENYKFTAIFQGYHESLIQQDSTLGTSLIIKSNYCCASIVSKITIMKPILIDNVFFYKKSAQYLQFYKLEIPKNIDVLKPIKFMTINDNYRLRYSPLTNTIKDTIGIFNEVINKPVYGNIIAEFEKGSIGNAVASYPDDTGRIWYFVIMSKDAKTTYSLFKDNNYAHKCGWMSSRFVNIIK